MVINKDNEAWVYSIALLGEAKFLFIRAIEHSEKGEVQSAYQDYQQGCQLLEEMGKQEKTDIQNMKDSLQILLYTHMQMHKQTSEIIQMMAFQFMKLYEKWEENNKWKK